MVKSAVVVLRCEIGLIKSRGSYGACQWSLEGGFGPRALGVSHSIERSRSLLMLYGTSVVESVYRSSINVIFRCM